MKVADPGRFALKGAVRAAVVMPLAFALGDVVIGNDQVALFAAFGSIALLILVEFGGSMRARLSAYVLLALVGAAGIAIGTLCSDSTALATAAMAAVGFGVLFAGVLNGYVAAAQPAVILSFALALMVPADVAQIPDRIAGWGIAAALATAAVLLVWPQRPRSVVRGAAARAARALAALIESEDPAERRRHSAEARTAIRAARRDFVSLQHRPSGTGGRTAALARLIEDLAWVRRFGAQAPDPTAEATEVEAARRSIEREVPAVLRQAAGQLDGTVPVDDGAPGGPGGEAVAELTRAHDRLGRAILARMAALAERGEEAEAGASRELDAAFRLRLLSFITAEVASTTRRTLGASVGGGVEVALSRLGAAGKLARAHASMRSVWLRNSLRGGLGLALAVLIAQLADIQNAFWVVLGTLSVLRSSALATGTSMASALAGCFAGIVVGGLLVVAVEGSEAALWILLPFATGLAAYTPRAVSFAAGQAGFSIVVLILFNLIHPSGWEVGLLRIEDVAIGAGVSLLVGLLFWPRGAVTVLRRALGSAYSTAAAYLDATVEALLAGAPRPLEAEREAFAAAQVLDSGVRDYLGDRSGANAPIEQLAVLMAGATRVREVAGLLDHSGVLIRLEPVDPALTRAAATRAELEADAESRCRWYSQLGANLAARQPAPDPEPAPPGSAPVVLERAPGDDGVPPGVAVAWARRYLEALRDLERPLAKLPLS